ncbi:MAG TPA: M20/M25/M40 family metallo-hydrolase [Thermomicrobiales bacterium]|nr:M20/M25/M40 family metallo-hydrolase [Thermomicrobiales bacterium]
MDSARKNFLLRLLAAPGPSGFEQAPAAIWRAEAETFADHVDHDVLGNSYAWLGDPTAPSIVIEGHIDEIGFLITYVDDDGFIWFDKIGGWDDQVVVGQRVTIATDQGEVKGVIGKKAAHLLKPADRSKVTEIADLWIDIGVKSRAEAMERVQIGDPIVIDVAALDLAEDLLVSRSVDNRVGAWVALEALRLLKERDRAVSVVAVAATQEEINMSGALLLSHRVKPLAAIAIDVTHATDYPGAGKKSDNDVKLGGGPVITRGSSINPRVFAGLKAAGERLGVSTPVQAAGRTSGTDADAILRSGAGVAPGLVSIPNRYMHSPNEVVSLTDLEQAAQIIAEFVSTVTPDTDFRP